MSMESSHSYQVALTETSSSLTIFQSELCHICAEIIDWLEDDRYDYTVEAQPDTSQRVLSFEGSAQNCSLCRMMLEKMPQIANINVNIASWCYGSMIRQAKDILVEISIIRSHRENRKAESIETSDCSHSTAGEMRRSLHDQCWMHADEPVQLAKLIRVCPTLSRTYKVYAILFGITKSSVLCTTQYARNNSFPRFQIALFASQKNRAFSQFAFTILKAK